jgi:hypothetical protein
MGLALKQDGTIHWNGHDQRSDVILTNIVLQLNKNGIGVIQKLHSHPDREELADFVFGRHLAQRLVDPLLAGLVDMDRTGVQKAIFVLVFISSKAERGREQKRDQQQMSEHAIDNSKNGRERPPADHATFELSNRSRTLSNFLFDGCNAFRLDGWVVAKPGQPMHIRFSTEPCDLALGIVTMRLLRRT